MGAQIVFPVGSIVRARGAIGSFYPLARLNVLNLKPMTGGDANSIGLYLRLEGAGVKEASFPNPDLALVGDAAASGILFDAARLLLRSSTAQFRCAGRPSFQVEALSVHATYRGAQTGDPIRPLVTDDVDIGKTRSSSVRLICEALSVTAISPD